MAVINSIPSNDAPETDLRLLCRTSNRGSGWARRAATIAAFTTIAWAFLTLGLGTGIFLVLAAAFLYSAVIILGEAVTP